MNSEDTRDKTLELDTANIAIAQWAEEYKKLETERDGFKEKADDFEAALRSTEARVAEFEKIQLWLRRRVRVAGEFLVSEHRTWGTSANAMVEYALGGEFPGEGIYPRDANDIAACKLCRDSCPYSLVEKMDEVLKTYKERFAEHSKEDEDA